MVLYRVIFLLFAGLVGLSSLFGQARATCTTNGAGTDWNTAANWDCGFVPRTSGWPYDEAVLDHDMTITSNVEFGGCCNPERSSLQINSGATLTVTGADLEFSGSANGGRLVLQSGGALVSNGDIDFNSERVSSTFASGSSLSTSSLTFQDAINVTLEGDITVGTLTVSGNASVQNTGNITTNTLLSVEGSSSFDATTTSVINADSLAVTGTSTASLEGTTNVSTGTAIQNSGDLTVESGSDLNTVNFTHSGSVGVTIDGTSTATGNVTITGSSQADGNGLLFWAAYSCTGTARIVCSSGGPITCPSVPTDPGIDLSTCNVALFANLLSFRGAVQEGILHFDWKTRSELNLDYFALEMSHDLRGFQEIDRIPSATHTSHSVVAYKHDLPKPFGSGAYFRLVSVDMDGKRDAFQVIYVSFSGGSEVSVFPNPVTEDLFYVRSDYSLDDHHLIVYDGTGKAVYRQELVGSSNLIPLPLGLTEGVYFLALHGKSQTHTLKFTVD